MNLSAASVSVILGMLILAGCSGTPTPQVTSATSAAASPTSAPTSTVPAAPTPDVAKTVQAAVMATMASVPTATPAATATPSPTSVPASPTPRPATATATTEPDLGGTSRDNPIPRGTSAEVAEGWKLTVLDVVVDAWPQIQEANQFNDPPKEGHQFFMVRVRLERIGAESAEYGAVGRVQAVGSEAVVYTAFENRCGVEPDALQDAEVFEGGVIEGNVCWEVRAEDTTSLVMFDEPLLVDKDQRVYFALR